MKALAWIVAIFAVAVGLTLLVRYNTGYVLLVLPPWRAEFSLNLLLLALALGLLWIGQGTGMVAWPQTSFMINQMPWFYRGVGLAVLGLIAVLISRRL